MNAALEQHIEVERKRLRQAHAVLACLSESLTHAESRDGAQHSDVVDVACDLLAASIEQLDLVVLRAVREQSAPYVFACVQQRQRPGSRIATAWEHVA